MCIYDFYVKMEMHKVNKTSPETKRNFIPQWKKWYLRKRFQTYKKFTRKSSRIKDMHAMKFRHNEI